VFGGHWGQGKVSDLALRERIQIVFQDPFSPLSPRLTVEEIVGEGLLVHHPELGAQQRKQQVEAALAEVGLSESTSFLGCCCAIRTSFPDGQRQRIAMRARADRAA